MTKKEEQMKKKLKTKKSLDALNSLGRSEFATAKMGVRIFDSPKSYNRKKEKAKISKEIRNYC